jgi:hypothetical protein
MTKSSGSDSRNTLYCSFCGKSQHEVGKLISGPTVFICNECVEKCVEIIMKDAPADDGRAKLNRDQQMLRILKVAKLNRDLQMLRILNVQSPLLPAPEVIRQWPKERVRFVHRSMRLWRKYQQALLEACPPDMEIDDYLGEYITQEEAVRLFALACSGPGMSLQDGMNMMFDPIAEQIVAPFDRVVELLRVSREGQPDVPL